VIEISEVTGELFRGQRLKTLADLEFIKAKGIKTIVNLEWGPYEEFHDDEYEHIVLADHGIQGIDIRCSDITPPQPWQVEKFLHIVKNHGPVYVHCLHGKDRTGFMVACYRMQVQQWSYDQAMKEMFEMGFHKFPYLFWLPALRKMK
jgi:protein tyrosine/serine phosphatase